MVLIERQGECYVDVVCDAVVGGPLSSRLAAPLPLSSAEAALLKKNKLLVIEQKTVRLGHQKSGRC